MMSCFEGLLEYYRAIGIKKWRIAVENFLDIVQFAVPTTDGKIFHVVDYGSAGKTRDDDSKITAWIYTK